MKWWLTFAALLALACAGMAWITREAMRLERAEAAARHETAREEAARNALWRMDSLLAPLVAREAARPWQAWQPYAPVNPTGNKFFSTPEKGALVVGPSPLLALGMPDAPGEDRFVRLHLQWDPDDRATSPQVPEDRLASLAVANGTTPDLIARHRERLAQAIAALPRQRLLTAVRSGTRRVAPPSQQVFEMCTTEPPAQQARQPVPPAIAQIAPATPPAQLAQREDPVQQMDAQGIVSHQQDQALSSSTFNRKGGDYQVRLKSVQRSQSVTLKESQDNAANLYNDGNTGISQNQQLAQTLPANAQIAIPPQPQSSWSSSSLAQPPPMQAGIPAPQPPVPEAQATRVTMPTSDLLRPAWIGGELVLARELVLDGRSWIQACWLDWPALERDLLAEVRDELPQARLVPAGAGAPTAHRLAALPVVLVPGPVPMPELPSPLATTLAVAWGAFLLAAAAAAALVATALRLGERRAAFVSAVTHELRTPLTTFRLYADLLAGGMVADEAGRSRLLTTLRSESDRLAHLVENVLAYARLERGRGASRERIAGAALIANARDRLRDRLAQVGLELVEDVAPAAAAATVQVDAQAVERILFNLADNAAKYAAGAGDRRVHLGAQVERGHLVLRLRDHGPGVAADAARRLFAPFSKSSEEAARTAPGVGLGLALSRRLARSQGGDLRCEPVPDGGACFALHLALAP